MNLGQGMTGDYIFVCDRGLVVYGQDAEVCDELAFAWRLNASTTIRRYGTTEGLAQLKDGPTGDTVLDTVCIRTLPFRSVIDIIHLTKKGEKNWREKVKLPDGEKIKKAEK
jgi:hypothetical protein